jgi:hypothetical protein
MNSEERPAAGAGPLTGGLSTYCACAPCQIPSVTLGISFPISDLAVQLAPAELRR